MFIFEQITALPIKSCAFMANILLILPAFNLF